MGKCSSRVWWDYGQIGRLGRNSESYGQRHVYHAWLEWFFILSAQVIASGDVAIYATLTSLATSGRSTIKALLVDNAQMRYFMDYGSAAYTRELVDCYMHARYQRLLEILRDRRVRDPITTPCSMSLGPLITLFVAVSTPGRPFPTTRHCCAGGKHIAKRSRSILSTVQQCQLCTDASGIW